jgi:hypothetical protein
MVVCLVVDWADCLQAVNDRRELSAMCWVIASLGQGGAMSASALTARAFTIKLSVH